MVFLHSGVGSAGEWKQVFSLWPEGYRLIAIDAYREGTGPGGVGRWSLDDYADQVYAVAEHVGDPVCLVGFSRGGATALRDRWRAHVRAGRWYAAFEEFVDFYNGPGAFARGRPHAARRFSPISGLGETSGTSCLTTTCSRSTHLPA